MRIRSATSPCKASDRKRSSLQWASATAFPSRCYPTEVRMWVRPPVWECVVSASWTGSTSACDSSTCSSLRRPGRGLVQRTSSKDEFKQTASNTEIQTLPLRADPYPDQPSLRQIVDRSSISTAPLEVNTCSAFSRSRSLEVATVTAQIPRTKASL